MVKITFLYQTTIRNLHKEINFLFFFFPTQGKREMTAISSMGHTYFSFSSYFPSRQLKYRLHISEVIDNIQVSHSCSSFIMFLLHTDLYSRMDHIQFVTKSIQLNKALQVHTSLDLLQYNS